MQKLKKMTVQLGLARRAMFGSE
ncbi:hypothetical protein Gotur_029359 [Gossypium turneri]